MLTGFVAQSQHKIFDNTQVFIIKIRKVDSLIVLITAPAIMLYQQKLPLYIVSLSPGNYAFKIHDEITTAQYVIWCAFHYHVSRVNKT